ncbi:hypothetical protein TorRG33x02_307090, partial [Trema orientale]
PSERSRCKGIVLTLVVVAISYMTAILDFLSFSDNADEDQRILSYTEDCSCGQI